MRRAFATMLALGLIALPGSLVLAQTPKPGEDAEREALRNALATACREFPREDQWQQADACRRAFFAAHEEAIWRLNINPHGTVKGPSS